MLDRLIELLKSEIQVRDVEINEGTSLKDDLGLDSLDMMSLVAEVEDDFKVEIDETELPGIHTVGDIISKLEEKLNPAGL
ncbi:acyl carrier protein [Anaerocolumna xylanovorans]|uniref:Acyl carrier protein n=1 Tax=Anaerocolumna xylanovorans DSM 12503 TaxID=1121345 RepID=A0A1M7YIG3_9FIRM|nr:phosphopantetheine-binding protein [Anaerocolumna xylanovorans]SHO52318.1 acyl carrier protein [Anaerocolumna xylanovorans DSM 12503]